MTNQLIIVGAGEQAEIAYEYFTHDSNYEVAAFSVEEEYIKKTELYGKPVIPYEQIEILYPASAYTMFVAIPSSQLNRLRTRFYLQGKSKNYKFASYISSHAFVWHNATIGDNTFIFENNVIQPFVSIGNNCILWSGNHVGHRTIIEDNVFIASHAVISGYCRIGAGSFVGVNSTINDNIIVSQNCVIGSGSLVTKNTEAEKIYVGSPAKAVPGKSSFDITL